MPAVVDQERPRRTAGGSELWFDRPRLESSRCLARADVMQLDIGRGHRDAVVELRTLAGAIGQQILARTPALIDVDATRVQQVSAQREVKAAGRVAGVREIGTRASRYASRSAGSTRSEPETMIVIACER